jgi:hypothetical protein
VSEIYEAGGRTVITSADLLRAWLIDPWARSVRPCDISTIPRGCGCCADADGRALSSILGRRQQCHPAFEGEHLLTGIDVNGPRWSWGADLAVKGFGLVVGGHFSRGFADTRLALRTIEHFVTFPPRRRRAQVA